jgi:hypothetical protein
LEGDLCQARHWGGQCIQKLTVVVLDFGLNFSKSEGQAEQVPRARRHCYGSEPTQVPEGRRILAGGANPR